VPASLEALAVELQRAPESTLLPLGGGTDGLAITRPDALYLLDGLLEPASVDETSATLDLPVSMTWGAAQALAVAYGLTLTDIPDAFADATIGGTLARQPWQPTLHHSATARARCIGLSAMLNTGERYRYKTASRTASGPDLRTHFLGRAGATGPILRATIEASREARLPHDLSLPLTAASLQAVVSLQRRFGRALRLLPTPAAATLRLRLRSDRLIKAVCGLANECPLPHHGTRFSHSLVILTDMHTLTPDGCRDFEMIVDDQGHAMLTQDRLHESSEFFDLLRAVLLGPQLQQIHTTFTKRSRHAFHLRGQDIAEIEDAIKAGVLQRSKERG
jgi:FAD/FMN-containing dehydrogenase